MVNAMWPSLSKGPWNTNGGYELPLTYAVVAAALAFTGPGRVSVDHTFHLQVGGVARGAGALALGVLSGALTLASRSFARPRDRGGTSGAWPEVGRTHEGRSVEQASSGNNTARR